MDNWNALIHAVTYWLSYQDRIGRQFMIEESSLKFPVADFVSGTGVSMERIELEFPHPYLKRRRIDLVTLDKDMSEIENAVEFKIAKPETQYESENKRIFHDLMRLQSLAFQRKTGSYFLIAGRFKEFFYSFRSMFAQRVSENHHEHHDSLPGPSGFYTEWFEFGIGKTKTIEISNSPSELYRGVYQSFLDEYESRDPGHPLTLPHSIKTTCMALSRLSNYFSTPYVGGIWKIE